VIAILPKPFTLEQLQKIALRHPGFYRTQPSPIRRPCTRRVRVLLVDDMHTGGASCARSWREMGIEHIHEAENGLQARELVDRDTSI